MNKKSNAGRKRLAPGEGKTAQISTVRCHPDERAQYDALGGAKWLLQAIARDYAAMMAEKPTTP